VTIAAPDGVAGAIAAVEATAEDAAIVLDLLRPVFGRSIDELPPQTRRLWSLVHAHATEIAQVRQQPAHTVSLDRRAIGTVTGWSYDQLRVHLERLVALEYLFKTERPGQVTTYRLVPEIGSDPPVIEASAETQPGTDAASTDPGTDSSPSPTASPIATTPGDTSSTAPWGTLGSGWGGVGDPCPPGFQAEKSRGDDGILLRLGAIPASMTPPGDVSATLRVASYQQQATGPSAVHHGVSG
jgi:hypothetical protein